MKRISTAFLTLFLLLGVGFYHSGAQADDSSDKSSEGSAIENLRTLCNTSVCLRQEIRILNYKFIGIDLLRPNGQVQQRFRKEKDLEFIEGGDKIWANGKAQYAELEKLANAPGGPKTIEVPLQCFPPCDCTLKPAAGPFPKPIGPTTVTSNPYHETIGGQKVNVVAISEYSIQFRMRQGTCKANF